MPEFWDVYDKDRRKTGKIQERGKPAPEGAYRQKLLDKLCRFYISGKGDAAADFTAERFPDADNYYWKNLLRTMPTPKLTAFYSARLGQPPKMEG